MNRFETRKMISLTQIWLIFTTTFFIIVFSTFIFSTNKMDASSYDSQKNHLQETIQKEIAQCYALEGTYPPSLAYLQEHYGLVYNQELFYVDYVAIGSNIYPDVSVIVLTQE